LKLQNRFFDALPEWVRSRMKKHLILREIRKGVSLSPADTDSYIFFPINCVVGVIVLQGESTGSFIRFAGRDSVFGLESLVLANTLRIEAWTVGTGYVLAIPTQKFLRVLGSSRESERLRLSTASALTGGAVINSVCCSVHSMSIRLLRLLLEAESGFGSGAVVTLTQNEIARLLGVRRESVANILGEWVAAGLVVPGRGRISLTDRGVLLTKVCHCYHETCNARELEFEHWRRLGWDERRTSPAEFAV